MDLKWREIYNTGVSKIDEQHQHLFGLLVEIYTTPMHEKGIKLKEHMQELIDYAIYHFQEEENYFKSINLPEDMLEHHKKEHKKYSIELNNIINSDNLRGIILSMTTIEFLKDWIIDHILGEDQEHLKYVRKGS